MSNEFGASHRQLVKDTNAGKVEAPSKAPTTSISGSRTHQVYGTDGKNELTRALLKTAMNITGKVIERRKEVDYAEGFDRGLEEGYAENETSPLRDALFGKSATLRGAQDRIIENDSTNWLTKKMKHLEDDSKQFNEEQYMEYLSQDLEGSMEDHKDPEVRTALKKQAVAKFQTLARNHAQQRQAWIDMENNQAVEDQMEAGIRSMEGAAQYGDSASQQEAMDDTERMFAKPATMDREVHLETLNRVIVRNLGKGQDVALRFAQEKGIIEQMRPEEQRKIALAKEVYDSKQGRNFHQSETILLARIEQGTATDSEIVAHQQKFKSRVDANELRRIKLKADDVLAEAAKLQAQADDAFISGDTMAFNAFTQSNKNAAVANHFDTMSTDGLAKIRAEAIQTGEYQGDPNAPFTQEDKTNYMLDNPYLYASAAARHPEAKYPAISNMANQIMFDVRNESLTEEDIPAVQKKMEFLEHFKDQMGNNFQKQFGSAEVATDYAVYSGLVKDAGYHPVNAMRDLRMIKGLPDVNVDDYADSLEDAAKDVEDEFLSTSEESSGIEGWWYKTDEFDDTLKQEIKGKLAKYTKVYKGDVEKAKYAAIADVRRNGVVSNGQFVEGGANVNIRGGSLEDYIRGINADDRLRAQITNLNLGFAADADYTQLKMTTDPYSKQNIILHGRHEKSGHPISVVLNTPTSGSEFSTYGVNSFSGYNPNIVNRQQRATTMTRDNVLLRGHRKVGEAIEKLVE